MNKKTYKYLLTIIALIIFITCKKPYLPSVIAINTGYLVVEGTINTGSDSTAVHLTHTIPISSPAGTLSPPELNATVTVESSQNATYPLTEAGNGYYIAVGLNLSGSNQYKLKIITSASKVYESDFVPVKNSPPMDSVSYQAENTSLKINVTTRDASNSTRYYRWDYNETWIIHSRYESFLELQKSPVDSIVKRPPADQIYTCWQSDQSSDIILASTAKLSNDILINYPVAIIPSTSEKLAERYSILIKQYAMTPDAFNYYQELRKNTESLGTIFDPQPSSLTGNIHCTTNPSEQVIGYITAGSASQARIYVNGRELPANANWIPSLPQFNCDFESPVYHPDPLGKYPYSVKEYLYTGILTPIQPLQTPGAAHPFGYTGASPICVDCTLRGSNKPPAFWR